MRECRTAKSVYESKSLSGRGRATRTERGKFQGECGRLMGACIPHTVLRVRDCTQLCCSND